MEKRSDSSSSLFFSKKSHRNTPKRGGDICSQPSELPNRGKTNLAETPKLLAIAGNDSICQQSGFVLK